MQKGPAMFKDNSAFNQKWRAILNKYSMDSILLIMEQSMATVAENDLEIETIKMKLQNDMDAESFANKFKKIQEEADALEKFMRDFKIRKFRRDKRDYTNYRVYNFTTRSKPKRVTWAENTYSDFDSADRDDSTGASGNEGQSYRSTYDRAAKGRTREIFFSNAPPTEREAERIIINFSSKTNPSAAMSALNLDLGFFPTPSYNPLKTRIDLFKLL